MNKKKSGFTLLELIIVMALTIVILSIIFQIFNISNRIFSDVGVKSTLQTDGQAIQEKLTSIGMQASRIDSINHIDKERGDMTITSYNKEGYLCKFKLIKDEKTLSIQEKIVKTAEDNNEEDDKNNEVKESILSRNVQSINISPSLNDNSELDNINSIELNITLAEKRGYSNIKYPINIKFNLRNKDCI